MLPTTRRLVLKCVPPIGAGAYRATERVHAAALVHAIRQGVRVIDTSPNYGSEVLVGGALRACLNEGACERS